MDRRDRHLVARTSTCRRTWTSVARDARSNGANHLIFLLQLLLSTERKFSTATGRTAGKHMVNVARTTRRRAHRPHARPHGARRPLVGYVVIALRALPHAWDHANHARDSPLINRSALPHISQRHTRAISDISPTCIQFVTHTAYRPACPGSCVMVV